jgi:pilus assembly protein CpaC
VGLGIHGTRFPFSVNFIWALIGGQKIMCRPWVSQVWRSRLAFALAVAAIFAVVLPTVRLQAQPEPVVRHVVIILHKSQTVSFSTPFKTASIASTDIADVTPLTDRSLYIQGKQIGTTSISVFDQNMQLVELLDLEVTFDARTLQEKIRARTGSNAIRVSADNGDAVLSGVVADAVVADRAVTIAGSAGVRVVNAMTVAPTQQVMMKVRFLEAARSAERDLGVNWFATNKSGTRGFSTGLGTPNIGPTTTITSSTSGGSTSVSSSGTNTGGISLIQSAGTLVGNGVPFATVLANLVHDGTNIDVMISALETKGLVRRLAEPDLVAMSGDEARFLAGGEFPVPQIGATSAGFTTPTFEFKKFGVSLVFVPTVLNGGLINLRIAPEVSELDFANAVTISGTTIPSLVVRNAQTTIELRDGQSFAIAGLFQSRGVRNLDQVPWVGSVPVLGALFRSAAFQNSETDLVIIVTPHLVRPATPVDRLASPLDQRLPSNDVDFFVNGQQEVPKRYSDYVTSGGNVNGPYGYILPLEQGSNQPVYKGGAAK